MEIIGRKQARKDNGEDLTQFVNVALDESRKSDVMIQKAILAKKWANVSVLQLYSGVKEARALLLSDGHCVVAGEYVVGWNR